MTSAETIRARRVKAGLTQAALAAAMGVAYQRIQEWERGRRNPNARSAQKLCHILGGEITDYLTL